MAKGFTFNVTMDGTGHTTRWLRAASRNLKWGADAGILTGERYSDGTLLATVADINNFGTADGRIPARPFFSDAVDDIAEELPDMLARLIDYDDLSMAWRERNEIGQMMVDKIRGNIWNSRGIYEPNAAATVNRKGKDHPLYHTSKLMDAIKYRVSFKRGGGGGTDVGTTLFGD